ncbi:hypothetical protein MP638_001979 [Amoeboaphelidium occidentale]|nr:hypothetical protein MP638_001979 [Amoeboaphelidium occidentale]
MKAGLKSYPYKCKYCNEKHSPRKCSKAPKCDHCNKRGHEEARCWLKHPELKSSRKEEHTSKQDSEHQEAKFAVAMMASGDASSDVKLNTFYIDSGSAVHLVNDHQLLQNPVPTSLSISTAGKSSITGVFQGDVYLNHQNQLIRLKNVIYAKELSHNLISVGQLIQEGYTIQFVNSKCIIKQDQRHITAIQAKGNVFKLSCHIMKPNHRGTSYFSQCPTTVHSQPTITPAYIHNLLGHIGRSKIRRLLMHDCVVGLPETIHSYEGLQYCEPCIKAKHPNHSFHSSTSSTTSVGEVLHADLAGPINPQSIGKKRYVLNVIDDFSRFCFTYLLYKKSDAAAALLDCIQWIKTQKSTNVKCIRTDRGGEFINQILSNEFRSNGIIHQTTAPYTPQQNGVAERYNRTLFETARSMLFSSDLPPTLWAEAILTANYTLNRVNVKAHETKTPYELFHGQKPNLSILQPFGIRCYVKDPEYTTKFQVKSVPGYLVGYEIASKAYRIFCLNTRTIIISRNVVFLYDSVKSGGDSTNNDFTVEDNEEDSKPDNQKSTSQLHPDNREIQSNNREFSGEVMKAKKQRIELQEDEPIHQLRSRDIYANLAEILRDFLQTESHHNCKIVEDTDHFLELKTAMALATEALPDEPSSYTDALKSKYSKEWVDAINDEIKSLEDNQTWTLVHLPPGRTPIKSKWVFKLKRDSSGNIARFKARLVAKGFSQQHGIDYHETFSPVVKFSSLRFLLALAAQQDWEIEQVDFTTAFLNGTLDEEIYLEVPEGLQSKSTNGKVLKLTKSLYGLKQAPRQWNLALNSQLENLGFTRLVSDEAIYIHRDDNDITIITIYVDDMVIIGNSKENISKFIANMHTCFKLKHLGPIGFIIGIQVIRDRDQRTISLSQRQYIVDIAKRFNITDKVHFKTPMEVSFHVQSHKSCSTTNPYPEAVGSLMYAMLGTRPDIAFAVGHLCRFMSQPSEAHWQAAIRVLSYLFGSKDLVLQYGPGELTSNEELLGYSDADFANDPIGRKSTSGFIVKYYNGAISWGSKRQNRVARSTTEAEYIALSSAAAELLWLRNINLELSETRRTETRTASKDTASGIDHSQNKDSYIKSVKLFGDNTASIQLAQNPKFHNRTKHFEIDYHWIREQVKLGKIQLVHQKSEHMLADALTKPLNKVKQDYFMKSVGLRVGSIRGSVEVIDP